eukprot:CAMPEP_0167767012 /NCGR_PEP_ID=MMETSP0110_2-20121227/15753_1 /TAXON_ID=629695 /ORGANISM="Gymnochlora sp., Strain CCMP2014" /LENGTH=202 /DNA_ID=CAMNT_0007655283 /DNA_START=713 /DNA_END=1321 /DNA_ORIENTATION=-
MAHTKAARDALEKDPNAETENLFPSLLKFDSCKILAKQNLLSIPILGNAISWGEHITLDRNSRRSQVKAFRKAKDWLVNGTALITFPEGTRTDNGRLESFRGGAFKIASSCGVPIIPVTIVSTQHVMPKVALLPTVGGRFLSEDSSREELNGPPVTVILHPKIMPHGKNEEQIAREAFEAIASALPVSQKPHPDTPALQKRN